MNFDDEEGVGVNSIDFLFSPPDAFEPLLSQDKKQANEHTLNDVFDLTTPIETISTPKLPPFPSRKVRVAIASKKHRILRKNERSNLKMKVDELETTLKNLQSVKSLEHVLCSPWEFEARNQCKLHEQACLDNKKLKEMIEDQKQLISYLLKILTQKSKLHKNLSNYGAEINDWLGSDPLERRRIMDLILDRQYRRLPSVLLQTGLVDTAEEINIGRLVPSHDGGQDYETLKNMCVKNVDYLKLSNALMNFCFGCDGIQKFGVQTSILEEVNNSTLYAKVKRTGNEWEGVLPPESKNLVRRFDESNRVVFVWKSVLKDECYPDDPGRIQTSESCWIVIENATENKVPATKKTRVKVMTKSLFIPLQSKTFEQNLIVSRKFNEILCKNFDKYKALESVILKMASSQ